MTTLAQEHDCLLLDLDGTVFRGSEPTTGAVETLAAVGSRALYVTNNASRGAAQVAQHLRELGFTADEADVVTSAQSAARLLRSQLPVDSRVFIVGTESLAAEIAAVGLQPVRLFSDEPVAVVQGHSTETAWTDLAEAALAIRAGALWVAANVDRTLPSERGLLPGNGSMVAALRTATDSDPQVAGKPAPTLMSDALARGDFHRPLAVGDRLDTDIEGANAAGLPSLMVLTGVSTAREAVFAIREQRPTFIGHDLRSLFSVPDRVRISPQPAWHVEVGADAITISATSTTDASDDGLAVVRAAAHALYSANTQGHPLALVAGDDTARAALNDWDLLIPPDRLA